MFLFSNIQAKLGHHSLLPGEEQFTFQTTMNNFDFEFVYPFLHNRYPVVISSMWTYQKNSKICQEKSLSGQKFYPDSSDTCKYIAI